MNGFDNRHFVWLAAGVGAFVGLMVMMTASNAALSWLGVAIAFFLPVLASRWRPFPAAEMGDESVAPLEEGAGADEREARWIGRPGWVYGMWALIALIVLPGAFIALMYSVAAIGSFVAGFLG